MWAAPDCLYCGRSLLGYNWVTYIDEQLVDGFICTAKHEETGGNVAFFIYVLENDEWVIRPRETNG